jgi:hypothetical protein
MTSAVHKRGGRWLAAAMAFFLGAGDGAAVEFLRGDANSDGVVTLADPYFSISREYRNGPDEECAQAGDANGDGRLEWADPIFTLNFLLGGGSAPPSPFPAPGPADESTGALPCESYGNGSPLADPAAALTVLDIEVPGGEEFTGDLVLAVSSSQPVGGFSCTLRFDPEVIGQFTAWEAENLISYSMSLEVCFAGDQLDISNILGGKRAATVGPGERIPTLRVPFCLQGNTPVTQSPITIERAELIDAVSGRAIHPRLEGGTLDVLAGLSEGAGCATGPCTRPPPPPKPETVNALFRVQAASVVPGGEFTTDFIVRADQPVQGFSYSIDFDEEVLECLGNEKLIENPAGFTGLFHNSANRTPGNGGIDEGYLSGAMVVNLRDDNVALPANRDQAVVRFRFRVRPEAEAQTTELRFLDGAGPHPTPNIITVHGDTYYPSTAESFIFLNGLISVLPEISTFIRGDSNGDQAVNLSDATNTLGFLFLGADRPACYDAADANDDGRIDVADPVGTLNTLFLGASDIAAPYAEPGEDPTPDALGCLQRYDIP